jgi:hypothetical protein
MFDQLKKKLHEHSHDLQHLFAHAKTLLQHEITDESYDANLALLKSLLQNAVTLEFATMPPYLTALWSIKDERHPIAQSLREIIHEEMIHMSFACNMLASIGGAPQIKQNVPVYPGHLPGGVHPDLTVNLSGLNEQSIADFMEIEMPEHVVTISGETISSCAANHDTVGELYDHILQLFERLKPPMSLDSQISGPLAIYTVDSLAKVNYAIQTIKTQGEGSHSNTPADTGMDDLAHFYRFWEIQKRKKIRQCEKTQEFIFAEDIEFPEVWPVANVPKNGYQQKDVSDEAWHLIQAFDETYTQMINKLDSAWNGGGQGDIIRAHELMFKLQEYAKPLMEIPVPNSNQHYAPCFRYVSET